MRWIGNIVLLCLCLGAVSAWPVMAQGIYRVIAPPPDTTVMKPDTTVRIQEKRKRWMIQPYFGGSSELNLSGFRVDSDLQQGIRPLVGFKVRLYQNGASLDFAAHTQLPGYKSRSFGKGGRYTDTRLSQATIDATIYLRANARRVRPYLTIGVGRLSNNTNDNVDSITFLHSGIGVEIAKSKRLTIPVGLYTNFWREPRGDEPALYLVLWYMTIGFNFYLN